MPRFCILLMLLAIALLAACSSTSPIDHRTAKQGTGACVAHADVDEVGWPSQVRLWAENTGAEEIVSWFWRIDGVWYDASLTGGVYWLHMHKPGTTNALLRGVDKNGNDCTSPIKIRARNNANAAPVVLFDGPLDFGEHVEAQADGTVLRYHEWRWNISRSYDPETEIVSLDWGIYGGGDLDGDGTPDTLYAGKRPDGSLFSSLPGLLVQLIDDPQQFILWVTPELTDGTLRMAVTATDTAAKPRKWSDGHVTLMK